jgi:hypothetical protein
MKNHKQKILRYGIQQGYFNVEEYCFIMNGGKIDDYDLYEILKDYPMTSYEKLCILKSNKLENKLDEEQVLNFAGAIY